MAQNQREINRLKHIIEEKDREIEMLRENEEDSGRTDPGITEDIVHRVSELEGVIKTLAADNGQAAALDTRIDELEGIIETLAADNAQAEAPDTRIDELEGMIKKLAASNTQAAAPYTRINELEGMVKGLTEELLDIKAEVRKFGKVLEGKEELKPKPEVRRARSARPAPEKVVKRPEASPRPEKQQPAEPELGTVTIMQPDGTLAEEPRMNHDDLIVAGNRPAKMYQAKSNREYRGKEEKKPLIYADEDDTVEIKKK